MSQYKELMDPTLTIMEGVEVIIKSEILTNADGSHPKTWHDAMGSKSLGEFIALCHGYLSWKAVAKLLRHDPGNLEPCL